MQAIFLKLEACFEAKNTNFDLYALARHPIMGQSKESVGGGEFMAPPDDDPSQPEVAPRPSPR